MWEKQKEWKTRKYKMKTKKKCVAKRRERKKEKKNKCRDYNNMQRNAFRAVFLFDLITVIIINKIKSTFILFFFLLHIYFFVSLLFFLFLFFDNVFARSRSSSFHIYTSTHPYVATYSERMKKKSTNSLYRERGTHVPLDLETHSTFSISSDSSHIASSISHLWICLHVIFLLYFHFTIVNWRSWIVLYYFHFAFFSFLFFCSDVFHAFVYWLCFCHNSSQFLTQHFILHILLELLRGPQICAPQKFFVKVFLLFFIFILLFFVYYFLFFSHFVVVHHHFLILNGSRARTLLFCLKVESAYCLCLSQMSMRVWCDECVQATLKSHSLLLFKCYLVPCYSHSTSNFTQLFLICYDIVAHRWWNRIMRMRFFLFVCIAVLSFGAHKHYSANFFFPLFIFLFVFFFPF